MLNKINPFSKEYKIKKEYLNIIKEYDKLVDYESDKSYDYLTSEIEITQAKFNLINIGKEKLLFSFNLLRKEISKDINFKFDLWKLKRLNKCKSKVFYIKKDLIDVIPIYTVGINSVDLNITDFYYNIKKDVIKNANLQDFFKKALINKINRKEDRLYKGLRKAIENMTNVKFPNTLVSIYDYYLYKKIKKASKTYFRIIISNTELINTNNLSFFEYCSKKFNVDIIIPI